MYLNVCIILNIYIKNICCVLFKVIYGNLFVRLIDCLLFIYFFDSVFLYWYLEVGERF